MWKPSFPAILTRYLLVIVSSLFVAIVRELNILVGANTGGF
jgi:hypothetical protein